MKKIAFILLLILLLAVIVSARLFYSAKNKNVPAQVRNSKVSSIDTQAAFVKFSASGNKIKILFLGDLMFDRYIRQVSEKRGNDFVFEKVKSLLQSEDLVVGNLEGPITDKPSVSVNSDFGSHDNYVFTFPPATAPDLFRENIKLVNLGNNHILNQGPEGLASTRNYLQGAGVNFFGDPRDQQYRFKIYTSDGLKLALVNYDQFVADGLNRAMDDIAAAKNQGVDIVILYTHWGTEFVSEPDQKIRDLAHRFIDVGADLIIGSHPHVIQSEETYKGKKIFYSLGNFLFDQYFQAETQQGMGVEVTVDTAAKNMGYKRYKFTLLHDGQTAVQN